MFVHSRIIFLGNAFLSKNTILSTSLSNITFLSVFLSTFLRAFSVERFLSALLSTFLSAFFVEHFFECFFEHYKHNSRYFRTLLVNLISLMLSPTSATTTAMYYASLCSSAQCILLNLTTLASLAPLGFQANAEASLMISRTLNCRITLFMSTVATV